MNIAYVHEYRFYSHIDSFIDIDICIVCHCHEILLNTLKNLLAQFAKKLNWNPHVWYWLITWYNHFVNIGYIQGHSYWSICFGCYNCISDPWCCAGWLIGCSSIISRLIMSCITFDTWLWRWWGIEHGGVATVFASVFFFVVEFDNFPACLYL